MKLEAQRRIAAEVLGVGKQRIWMDPKKAKQIGEAITKEEIRKLIKEGAIKVRPEKGRRRKERRKWRGPGRRKGARGERKERWVEKVKALRKFLRKLWEKGVLRGREYRRIRRMIKGGLFEGIAHLRSYLQK